MLALAGTAVADNAAFDLVGPKVDVRVQRSAVTLPLSQVPNLQAGDRLWVHPDLPESQSVHYLMVVVFFAEPLTRRRIHGLPASKPGVSPSTKKASS